MESATRGETKKGSVERVELARSARNAARRAAEARATIPHLQLERTVGPLRRGRKDAHAVLLAALGRALGEFPQLNAAYRDGGVERFARVNVGFVVQIPDGPIMPTVFDADRRDVEDIAERLGELRAGVRDGSLPPPALAGATCSLQVLDQGADSIAPTIVPGQVSALAFGREQDADDPHASLRTATLCCDERAVTSGVAAGFLERLAEMLDESGAAEA
jgi:pyruvate dehydrogenase E2 component (dihydrolipoamide acetyltransferase)